MNLDVSFVFSASSLNVGCAEVVGVEAVHTNKLAVTDFTLKILGSVTYQTLMLARLIAVL